MRLAHSTVEDISQIQEWITKDEHHKNKFEPSWWLTGQGLLSFVLMDDEGPICFTRLDYQDDNGLIRFYTQFGPREEVNKERLVAGLMYGVPIIVYQAREHGAKGMVFDTENPSLASFMNRFGFKPVGTDYVLDFEAK